MRARIFSSAASTSSLSEAHKLEEKIAASLQLVLRERFSAGFDEAAFESNPNGFPTKLVGLARLVTDPRAVLDSLDAQQWHTV